MLLPRFKKGEIVIVHRGSSETKHGETGCVRRVHIVVDSYTSSGDGVYGHLMYPDYLSTMAYAYRSGMKKLHWVNRAIESNDARFI